MLRYTLLPAPPFFLLFFPPPSSSDGYICKRDSCVCVPYGNATRKISRLNTLISTLSACFQLYMSNKCHLSQIRKSIDLVHFVNPSRKLPSAILAVGLNRWKRDQRRKRLKEEREKKSVCLSPKHCRISPNATLMKHVEKCFWGDEGFFRIP